MANIEERIKSMQEAVEDAKRGVRATMTVEELSRESIRDIVKEVSETNTALDAVFNEGNKEVSVNTRHLRSELMKLIEGGGDASKERLKEIEQKARDIAQVALEESPEEAEYLGQLAANVQGAARKARKAASGLGGNMIGESLFTGIFGQSFGGWLLSPGQKRGRGQAETLLDLRQNELETLTGGGGGETPSEVAEEKREQEIRQVEVERKEDTVITLLNRILLLLGKNGVSDGDTKVVPLPGSGKLPIIAATTAVTVPATVLATKSGRQAARNAFRWLWQGPKMTRQFSTLAQRPGTTIAQKVLNTAEGKAAARLTEKAIHLAEDGIAVTINKNGRLVVRNAAGEILKDAHRVKYLKNLGLPLKMPPGSTIEDVFKVATRGLAKNATKPFLQRFIYGFGRAGLKSAAMAEGPFAAVFAGVDFLNMATNAYIDMGSGFDLGLTHKNMDVQAGLYGGASALQGLNYAGELVNMIPGVNVPGAGQSTQEVAQGLEAALFGTDMSNIFDWRVRMQSIRKNRKKDLDSMAGGFDNTSTLGKRLLYAGQFMNLMLAKTEDPSIERWMVDVSGTTKSISMSWQEAYDFLAEKAATWIEIEEAERNNRPYTKENIQNIEASLKSGNFNLQGVANDNEVSLIPWMSYVGEDNRAMFGGEMRNKMRTSNIWGGILSAAGDASVGGSNRQSPNLLPNPNSQFSDRPSAGGGPVMIDGSSVHNNFVQDNTVDLETLREVDPNTVNITLD